MQARAGVASTIIGARTIAQLDDNIAALDLRLSPEDIAGLDKVSTPTLPFPVRFLGMAGMFIHGGATVNGDTSIASPLAPKSDAERY